METPYAGGETVTDDRGKRIMSIDLQEVEVVARSKVVVERMGKVTIDFQITVPEQLQGIVWVSS